MAQRQQAKKRWGKIPEQAAADPRLSARDLRVLIALSLYANRDGMCWPKRRHLSEKTGLSLSHVSDSTSRLMRFGYLLKIGQGGRSRPATYQIIAAPNGPGNGTLCKPETVPFPGEGLRGASEALNRPASGTRTEQKIHTPEGSALIAHFPWDGEASFPALPDTSQVPSHTRGLGGEEAPTGKVVPIRARGTG